MGIHNAQCSRPTLAAGRGFVIVCAGHTEPSPAELLAVERDLRDLTGGEDVAWFGRGATALYYAFLAARTVRGTAGRPEAIIPAIACPSLAHAAYLAGVIPRFAECDPATGLMATDAVEDRWTPQTVAVVFIHLYGSTADMAGLAAWCRGRDVVLIEDNAQALGARLPGGEPVGATGDLSIYSFSRSKILDAGGGALLVRSEGTRHALNEVLKEHPLGEPLDGDCVRDWTRSYRDLQRSLVMALREDPKADVSERFARARPDYDKLYLRPFSRASDLPSKWPSLTGTLERRRQKARLYDLRLEGGPWRCISGWRTSGVCWRYSLLVNEARRVVAFCAAVRRDGFHVSNLFWPLHLFVTPDDACSAAEGFGRAIVNLWVDDTVDLDYVEGCAASLRSHACVLAGS